MGVLGTIFDSKLQWHSKIQNAITKSIKALHAITIIKKYFNKNQLLSLIMACYYSILYFNCEIWLLPSLSPQLKQKLLSVSATPVKLTTRNYDRMMSFETLHYLNKRATPNQMILYKHALLLHKVYHNESMSVDWTNLFFTQHFNSKENCVRFFNTSSYKIGNNILSNIFVIINEKIQFDWLNNDFNSYKIKCKNKFFPHEHVL